MRVTLGAVCSDISAAFCETVGKAVVPADKQAVLGGYLGSEIVVAVSLDRRGSTRVLRQSFVVSQCRSEGIGGTLLAGAIEKLDELC